MESKEELIQTIKQWTTLHSEIKILQQEVKQRKQELKSLSNSLVEVMKQHELDGIDVNDGKIVYSQTKTKSAISKKYLLKTLAMYFQSTEEAEKVSQFLLESRTEKINESIRFKG